MHIKVDLHYCTSAYLIMRIQPNHLVRWFVGSKLHYYSYLQPHASNRENMLTIAKSYTQRRQRAVMAIG